jgi:hypothetical protein
MSKRAEEAAEKVFKENPYPKYLGKGLYQVADNCIVGEKMMKVIDEMVHKQMICKWFRGGDCGKGLPGTPCEIKGCVAWGKYKEEE